MEQTISEKETELQIPEGAKYLKLGYTFSDKPIKSRSISVFVRKHFFNKSFLTEEFICFIDTNNLPSIKSYFNGALINLKGVNALECFLGNPEPASAKLLYDFTFNETPNSPTEMITTR